MGAGGAMVPPRGYFEAITPVLTNTASGWWTMK